MTGDERGRPGDDEGHANHLESSRGLGDAVQARDVHGGVHFHKSGSGPDVVFTLIPSQLPGDVRGFVNRHSELATLASTVAENPEEPLAAAAVIITGTAGVGKTSLALHWAHGVSDRFPDGQLYVNLRGYDPGPPVEPGQVLERFLADLGVPATAIPPLLADRASMYRSLLATRRMLVLLDNAATATQVRPLLPGTARSLVLATSRNRLSGLVARDGAVRLGVDVLPADDAVSLLRDVTDRYRAGDQPSELLELARLCARLPLALRIAAERAASRPMMQLDELIADLRDESALWDALSAEGADDTDAVRTVFAWSYRALPESAARLFRLLGLHPAGDFGVPAAAALAAMRNVEVRRELDVLIGAHLLEQPRPGRYQFHDLLRAYATDQARSLESPENRAAAGRRMFEWYLHSAYAARQHIAQFDLYELAEPPPGDVTPLTFDSHERALHWYQTERPNLLAVTQSAADGGQHDVAWRLAAVLRGIYMHQNHFDDWLRTGRTGLESASTLGDLAGQAVALDSLGKAYFQSRRLDEAEDSHGQALRIRQDIGDRFGEAVSLNALGLIGLRRRQLSSARAYFEQGAQVFRELGDRRWEALLHGNLAECLCELGQPRDALDALRPALQTFDEVGDRFGAGNALFLLSWAHRELGEIDNARSSIDRALAIADERQSQVWQAHWLVELGKVQRAAGDPAGALVSYQRALLIQRQLGDRSRAAFAVEGAGHAYLEMDRPEEAVDFFRSAVTTYREVDDRWSLAQALHHLAGAVERLGAADDARQHREEALALLGGFDDRAAAALRLSVSRSLGPG